MLKLKLMPSNKELFLLKYDMRVLLILMQLFNQFYSKEPESTEIQQLN